MKIVLVLLPILLVACTPKFETPENPGNPEPVSRDKIEHQVGNGGDMCENRIKIIREDLEYWIKNGGSAGLLLPNGLDLPTYNKTMREQIQKAKISCTDSVVLIEGFEKTCKNLSSDRKNPEIICNVKRFSSTDESDQYVLIHHEFAGLSGFEVNEGAESVYPISNQISLFLENVVIKKLAIKPQNPSPIQFSSPTVFTNLINAKTTSCFSQILSPDTSNDIEARYIRLASPRISWAGTETDAHISGIHFRFAGSPLGSFSKDIAGDELRALFNNVNPSADNVIPAVGYDPNGRPNPPSFKTLSCAVLVGGIQLSESQDVSFDMKVEGSLQGYSRNVITSEEIEFTAPFSFTVRNRGANN